MALMKTLNQMITQDENILSFVTVPSDLDLNADTLKLAIVRRCGDVEPYYQDATQFQLFGALWFNSHSFLFKHAVAILESTYNPIENYDRTETETIEGTKTGTDSRTDTHGGTDTTTSSGNRSNTDTHGGTTGTTTSGADTHSGTDTINDSVTRENEIAGFDSSTYSDANKETETGTHTTAHGETLTKSGTETVTHGETITTQETTGNTDRLQYGHTIGVENETAEDTETTRNLRVHGNIGVTTNQQMIEAEMELARRFWIYDYIANAFESDNFITVYESYFEGSAYSNDT